MTITTDAKQAASSVAHSAPRVIGKTFKFGLISAGLLACSAAVAAASGGTSALFQGAAAAAGASGTTTAATVAATGSTIAATAPVAITPATLGTWAVNGASYNLQSISGLMAKGATVLTGLLPTGP